MYFTVQNKRGTFILTAHSDKTNEELFEIREPPGMSGEVAREYGTLKRIVHEAAGASHMMRREADSDLTNRN